LRLGLVKERRGEIIGMLRMKQSSQCLSLRAADAKFELPAAITPHLMLLRPGISFE